MILGQFGSMDDLYRRQFGSFATENTEDTEKDSERKFLITTKDTKGTKMGFNMICVVVFVSCVVRRHWKCAFHDEAQAAVGYSTGRGSISTKKLQVTG